MAIHEKSYDRMMNVHKALHKRYICRHIYGFDWYKNLHAYSKNKIFCSCWMCRDGKDCFHNSNKRKKISEQKKIDSMTEQLMEDQNNVY